MTVAKLMGMHSGRSMEQINSWACIGHARTASTGKFSFYVEVDEPNTANLRLFEGFVYLAEDGKMLRCKEVPPTKYSGEDEGEERLGIRAFYFTDNVRVESGDDSDGEEEFSAKEIVVLKSMAKFIKRTAAEEEVRLRTSVEEG